MANYHVMKNKETNKWVAKREGAECAAGSYGNQAEAEKAAKGMSSNSGGGEVRIQTSSV
jgi:hypothetical protein